MAPDYKGGFAQYISTDFGYKPITLSVSGVSFITNLKIEKYIINDGATILFWNDGDKTVSKRQKEDKFDKEIGFLFAYFYKKYNGSKASMKRVIDCIDYKKIKTFLFEFYVNDTGKEPEKARKFLKNLKVENK